MAPLAISLSLLSRFASSLPLSVRLLIHHIISEKHACPELFSAPPGELPEATISESHLLSVSIRHNGQPLQVFALEIYVYETDYLTTIFVSKADSTGCLHLLNLPPGTPSPIKTVTTTFLEWLVETKRRSNTRLLLSLFARAQNQYLFPGSIDNSGKHVLSDRELIRWWCKVLDPVVLRHVLSDPHSNQHVHAHLVVPGLDPYETRSYFPASARGASGIKARWSATDPLQGLGKPEGLPPRCYIPRFPDDPKARFAVDLDDELPDLPQDTTVKAGRSPGIWKSAKSLAQFWELMSFRQECSAGRLVGFAWVVFEPIQPRNVVQQTTTQNTSILNNISKQSASSLLSSQVSTDRQSVASETTHLPSSLPLPSSQDYFPSPITPPQSQTIDNSSEPIKQDSEATPIPQDPSKQDHQKTSTVQLDRAGYNDLMQTLDSLDYANLEVALESTAKFLNTVSQTASIINGEWGAEIVGLKALETQASSANPSIIPATDSKSAGDSAVNIISAGLVRRKKRPVEETPTLPAETKEPETHVLTGDLVRKKPKV